MTLLDPGGFRASELKIAEESTQGEIETDPAYETIADTVISVEYEGLGAEQVERPAIGESVADLVDGVSEPAITVEYEPSRWLYDNSGDPDDLVGYALNRQAGRPYSSLMWRHQIRMGDDSAGVYVSPSATLESRVKGTSSPTAKEARRVAVGVGVDVEEGTMTGDQSEGVYVTEASLAAEEVRVVQFDQPTTSQTMDVSSTDSADTSLHVTIEDDSGTTETIQLDGTDATTAVSGATSFDTIANVAVFKNDSGSPGERSFDHAGDIRINGSSSSELYASLVGTNNTEQARAFSGTPLTGAGSTTTAPTSPYAQPQSMSVERPSGTGLISAGDVSAFELSVGVDITRTPSSNTRQRNYPGLVTPEASITFDGETAVIKLEEEEIRATATDTVLDFAGDGTYTVTLPSAKVTEAGATQSAGENAAENEATLRAQSMPTVSNAP